MSIFSRRLRRSAFAAPLFVASLITCAPGLAEQPRDKPAKKSVVPVPKVQEAFSKLCSTLIPCTNPDILKCKDIPAALSSCATEVKANGFDPDTRVGVADVRAHLCTVAAQRMHGAKFAQEVCLAEPATVASVGGPNTRATINWLIFLSKNATTSQNSPDVACQKAWELWKKDPIATELQKSGEFIAKWCASSAAPREKKTGDEAAKDPVDARLNSLEARFKGLEVRYTPEPANLRPALEALTSQIGGIEKRLLPERITAFAYAALALALLALLRGNRPSIFDWLGRITSKDADVPAGTPATLVRSAAAPVDAAADVRADSPIAAPANEAPPTGGEEPTPQPLGGITELNESAVTAAAKEQIRSLMSSPDVGRLVAEEVKKQVEQHVETAIRITNIVALAGKAARDLAEHEFRKLTDNQESVAELLKEMRDQYGDLVDIVQNYVKDRADEEFRKEIERLQREVNSRLPVDSVKRVCDEVLAERLREINPDDTTRFAVEKVVRALLHDPAFLGKIASDVAREADVGVQVGAAVGRELVANKPQQAWASLVQSASQKVLQDPRLGNELLQSAVEAAVAACQDLPGLVQSAVAHHPTTVEHLGGAAAHKLLSNRAESQNAQLKRLREELTVSKATSSGSHAALTAEREAKSALASAQGLLTARLERLRSGNALEIAMDESPFEIEGHLERARVHLQHRQHALDGHDLVQRSLAEARGRLTGHRESFSNLASLTEQFAQLGAARRDGVANGLAQCDARLTLAQTELAGMESAWLAVASLDGSPSRAEATLVDSAKWLADVDAGVMEAVGVDRFLDDFFRFINGATVSSLTQDQLVRLCEKVNRIGQPAGLRVLSKSDFEPSRERANDSRWFRAVGPPERALQAGVRFTRLGFARTASGAAPDPVMPAYGVVLTT